LRLQIIFSTSSVIIIIKKVLAHYRYQNLRFWQVPSPDGGLRVGPASRSRKTTGYRNIDNRIYGEHLPGSGRVFIVRTYETPGQTTLED